MRKLCAIMKNSPKIIMKISKGNYLIKTIFILKGKFLNFLISEKFLIKHRDEKKGNNFLSFVHSFIILLHKEICIYEGPFFFLS